MQPAASPRHPWKALAAALAMFALVHGAGAHVFSQHHDARWHASPAAQFDVDADDDDDERDRGDDCQDGDIDFGPNFPFYDDGVFAHDVS